MAAGDLSADQARYVDLVAQATGLDRRVVVAWVGTESGWGTNKAGHNYLNIGPGRTYQSADQAAAAAAALVNASSHYAGIRAALPSGPAAQIKAIGASPWGTEAALLDRVYGQVAGGSSSGPVALTTAGAGVAVQLTGGGGHGLPFLPECSSLPDPLRLITPCRNTREAPIGDALAGTAKSALSVLGVDIDSIAGQVAKAGLGLVFAVAAFALMAMGLNRLTGQSPKGIFDRVSSIASVVPAGRALAAVT